MKEAGSGSDPYSSDPSATDPQAPAQGTAPANGGKAAKDMKGLVYQGSDPDPSAAQPIEPAEPNPEEQKPEEEKPEDVGYKGVKGDKDEDTVMTFTEKDNKVKLIAVLIIAILLIAAVAYLLTHTKATKGILPASSTTTINALSNSSTTSIRPPDLNVSHVYNIDMDYNYTGPAKVNGSVCERSNSQVISLTAVYNAFQPFGFYVQPSSGLCPLKIVSIKTGIPGFRISSVSPSLPYSIPTNSSVYIHLSLIAPGSNYTGPIVIDLNTN